MIYITCLIQLNEMSKGISEMLAFLLIMCCSHHYLFSSLREADKELQLKIRKLVEAGLLQFQR